MSDIINQKICSLYETHSFIDGFFESFALVVPQKDEQLTVIEWIDRLDQFELEQIGLEKEKLPSLFVNYIENMNERKEITSRKIDSITIVGGQHKDGSKENITLELLKGDVVAIVGPTGSGKSRLLGDIEWLAQKDTPTKRQILINGEVPPKQWRFSIEHKLVAQLSQNMNFVMDISVGEFIKVHCESRLVTDYEQKKDFIIKAANRLAGEPISQDMPITSLSGGQSRALMIADTAYLSTSPIVLIDEIENAGIHRQTALDLLIKAEKIILIATHDPVLALSANKRVVIKNGGMHKIIKTSNQEKEKLHELNQLNETLLNYREHLKRGDIL
ncbi:MAG: ATP-binding cassette domain-containing protein [Eubacteriales bacterium]